MPWRYLIPTAVHRQTAAEEKTDNQADDKRQTPINLQTTPYYVEDIYWLTVLDEQGVPLFDVHHDSASFTFVDSRVLTSPENYQSGLRENFPEPDEIVVDWHDLAEILKVSKKLDYILATCSAANIWRRVWGYGSWWVDTLLYPGNPQMPADGLSHYDFDYNDLRIMNCYAPNAAGVDSLVPPDVPTDELQNVGTLRWQQDAIPYLRPTYRSTPLCDSFIALLQATAGNKAIYQGEGFFSVKSADLRALAAGTGNWGSGEIGWVGFAVDILKDGGSAFAPAAGVAGLVATGCSVWRQARSDELTQDRVACRDNATSTADCVDCVMSGEEGVTMIVEGVAGGAGVIFGLAAAAAATGVGVPIAIALAVAGGIFVAVDIGLNANSIQQFCAGNRQ